jgi:hypothetical protein
MFSLILCTHFFRKQLKLLNAPDETKHQYEHMKIISPHMGKIRIYLNLMFLDGALSNVISVPHISMHMLSTYY